MKTYNFKEAIKVLSHGGFIKEPMYHFTTHAPLFDGCGIQIGQVTYNCYFDITDALGYTHNGGLLKSGKYSENSELQESWGFNTITGDFNLVVKMAELA